MCRTTRFRNEDVVPLAEVILVTEASLASRLPWIKLNYVGSRLRRIGSNLKSVISQCDQFGPLSDRRCRIRTGIRLFIIIGRKNFQCEIRHEEEAGEYPSQLQPEESVDYSFPQARMQSRTSLKTSGDDQAIISAHVAEGRPGETLQKLDISPLKRSCFTAATCAIGATNKVTSNRPLRRRN